MIGRPLTAPGTATSSEKVQKAPKRAAALAICVTVVLGAAVTVAVVQPWAAGPAHNVPVGYLGVYEPDAPGSYAGVDRFARAIGRQPNLVSYYSPWLYPFQAGFARSAGAHGAMTVVQIDPKGVSVASIAAGQYDTYLRSYAEAVKAFGARVTLSFGHEMNGYWYSWGNRRTSARVFVAAWRHIVSVFRAVGTANVVWLWTVNVINADPPIPSPEPWWPGSSYVTWVGIDGYYFLPSQTFSQVFGATIAAVRGLTADPILIAETGAPSGTGEPASIDDLFAGIRTYGLSGFVWFDKDYQGRAWRLNSPQAFNAFRQDAREFMRRGGSS